MPSIVIFTFLPLRLQPAYVVVYDPDVAFTRQLELYKAGRCGGWGGAGRGGR